MHCRFSAEISRSRARSTSPIIVCTLAATWAASELEKRGTLHLGVVESPALRRSRPLALVFTMCFPACVSPIVRFQHPTPSHPNVFEGESHDRILVRCALLRVLPLSGRGEPSQCRSNCFFRLGSDSLRGCFVKRLARFGVSDRFKHAATVACIVMQVPNLPWQEVWTLPASFIRGSAWPHGGMSGLLTSLESAGVLVGDVDELWLRDLE